MLTVLLLCLVGVTIAQQPLPCASPPQWEGRIFDSNEKQRVSLQGKVSYDSVYHRTRVIENVEFDDDDLDFDILTLFDAKVQFIYDLKYRNCSRRTPDGPWEDFAIPPDAKSLGEAYIGSSAVPSGGLLVTIWSGNYSLPNNETIPYMGSWTYEGCVPVSRLAFSEKYGNEILSFYDVTAGIGDPNVFIPRRECLTEQEYAARNVLFGKPTKKN